MGLAVRRPVSAEVGNVSGCGLGAKATHRHEMLKGRMTEERTGDTGEKGLISGFSGPFQDSLD